MGDFRSQVAVWMRLAIDISALSSDNFSQLGGQIAPADHLPVADELVAQRQVALQWYRESFSSNSIQWECSSLAG